MIGRRIVAAVENLRVKGKWMMRDPQTFYREALLDPAHARPHPLPVSPCFKCAAGSEDHERD